jgi:hypothetical protein
MVEVAAECDGGSTRDTRGRQITLVTANRFAEKALREVLILFVTDSRLGACRLIFRR